MAKYYAVASAVRISPFFHLVNSIPNSDFASSQMYSFGMVESWPNMALVVQAHIRCAVLLVSHPTYHYSLIPRPHSTRSGNEAIPTIAYLVPRPCSTQPEWGYTNPCLPRSQAMFHTAWEWGYTNPCLPRSQATFHTAWEWGYTNPCLPLGDLTIDTRSSMTLPRGTFDLSTKNNRILTNIKKMAEAI